MSITNEILTLVSKAAQKQVSEHEELLASGLIDSIS
ncbi:MAG: acyl carrier protein, partial [Neisseria sp.]